MHGLYKHRWFLNIGTIYMECIIGLIEKDNTGFCLIQLVAQAGLTVDKIHIYHSTQKKPNSNIVFPVTLGI